MEIQNDVGKKLTLRMMMTYLKNFDGLRQRFEKSFDFDEFLSPSCDVITFTRQCVNLFMQTFVTEIEGDVRKFFCEKLLKLCDVWRYDF